MADLNNQDTNTCVNKVLNKASDVIVDIACKESGTIHEESGTLHEESGIVHEDSGIIHEEPGTIHEESGNNHEESGNSHEESGISIVQEESGIFIDSEKLDVTVSNSGQISQEAEFDISLGLRQNDSDLSIEGEKSPSIGKSSSALSDFDVSEGTCDTQTDSGITSGTNSSSSNHCKTSKDIDAKHPIEPDHSSKQKMKITEINGNSDGSDKESDVFIKVLNNEDKNHVPTCDNENNSCESKVLIADLDCDKVDECDITDCMPTSLDTEDSDPIGSYDVAMATVSNSEGEQNSESNKIKKNFRLRGKRKYRVPRIKSDSDTESDTTENVDMNSGGNPEKEDSQLDSDDSDFSADHFDDIGDDDDYNDEEAEKKLEDSKSESEEEESGSTKYRHTWKALYDLRSREYGSNNRTPPAVFREKVHGSVQMVQRFKLQYKMEYHEGCVNALHFNRIGTLLASGSDDLNIVLWNWIRNRPALVYDSGHRSNVFQAKFMPFSGDCHVVSCARDGQVRLGELSLTGVCKGTKKLAQHKGAAHKLALELDSPHVFLSCGEDAMVFEVDLRQEKPNKLVQTKENDKKVPLYSINSNPVNSCEFCVGGRDHYIRVYDKRKICDENTGLVKKYCPHKLVDSSSKANVTCAVYSYNGTEILGSYNDDDIYSFSNFDSDGAEYIHRYGGHRNNATVKGVNFYGPRSEFVVSGSDCGHIYLWDRETEEIVQFLSGDEGGVINVLEPHPFAPILATSGLDHDVKVWVPTQEETTQLKNLKKTVRQNRKERDEERLSEPRALEDMIDGHMLYYLMRQIHRARRRNEPDEEGSSSSSSEFDSDDSDDPPNRINCAQS